MNFYKFEKGRIVMPEMYNPEPSLVNVGRVGVEEG